MGIRGEGSRGGHVVGHFSSGRAIYGAPRDVLTAKEDHTGARIAGVVAIGAMAASAYALHRNPAKLSGLISKMETLSAKKIAREGVGGAINATIGSGIGLIPGGFVGGAVEFRLKSEVWPKLKKDFKSGEQVNSKATIHGDSRYKNIEVITNREDLMASKTLTDEEKEDFYGLASDSEAGDNAAAWKHPTTGQEYVFASKKVNKQVLGHELGHIEDYRSGFKGGENGFFSALTGKQVEKEERGWDKSPYRGPEDEPVKTHALQTYKAVRTGARITAAITAATAAAFVVAGRR